MEHSIALIVGIGALNDGTSIRSGNNRKHNNTFRKRQETKTCKLETKRPQVETQKNIFMGIMILSKTE